MGYRIEVVRGTVNKDLRIATKGVRLWDGEEFLGYFRRYVMLRAYLGMRGLAKNKCVQVANLLVSLVDTKENEMRTYNVFEQGQYVGTMVMTNDRAMKLQNSGFVLEVA